MDGKGNWFEQAVQMLAAWNGTAVIQGDDSWSALDEFVQQHNCRKAAVFTGCTSADRSGAWSKLLNSLRYADCAVVRFKNIPPEPDMETVNAMADFLRRENADTVIALGGGSVLDAAKAALIVQQSTLPLEECFGTDSISKKFPDRNFKRIIAIPTTSGTGSEITHYSNIVNRSKGVKQLISDPVLAPEIALLDGALTCSMPQAVTLATGCDALAHLLEGWLNVNMDENKMWVNEAAALGVLLLMNNLRQALVDPADRRARKALQLASALGGLTIRNKSTGLPHLLSFSWFGRIEHGIAVARLLPAAWRYYICRSEVEARTCEIGKVLGGNTASEVIGNYEKLLDSWQVPLLTDFPELDRALLEQTCLSAGANRMKLELAPRPVPLANSADVLRMILNDAWQK
ncbi:MAG: iron-containing alcohol dehydrogenase [Lentisphaerae bacterium]|nr:iron-containing alcohol dehydrogenase [Lentisphaerota bacterium]